MRPLNLSLLLLAAISTATGQLPAQTLSFEVASIKAADPAGRGLRFGLRFSGGPGTDSPGQLVVRNYPLDGIIGRAFEKTHGWDMVTSVLVPTDRYDIDAKAPAGVTREQFAVMTQNLLAERFGLVAHREIRDLPVYELVVAKDGHHLTTVPKPTTDDQPGQSSPPRLDVNSLPKDKDGWPILPPDAAGRFSASVPPYRRMMFRAQPFSALLDYLRFVLDRPVVDNTGLNGLYNFDLTLMRIEMSVNNADTPAAERAQNMRDADDQTVRNLLAGIERLGLKVISAKGPVEVLVVDKVNRKPTAN